MVYANHEMSHRVAEMTFAAMHRIAPDRVMAGSQGTSGIDHLRRHRLPHRRALRLATNSTKGGFGARPVKDGINAVSAVISNMLNTPIEVLEMSFPLRVEEYALVPDSGGAGTWRGGLGVRRSWRVLGRDVAGRRLLRAAGDAALRPGRRQGGRPRAALHGPAGRHAPDAAGQGRLHRARRRAGDGRGAGRRRLRPAGRPRPRSAALRPPGRLRDAGGGGARLRGG